MKSVHLLVFSLIAAIGLTLTVGCGEDSGEDSNDEVGSQTNAALMGRVSALDRQGGFPIAATVTVGDQTVEANNQGWFSFTTVPRDERLLVEVSADGFVWTQRPITVASGSVAFLDAKLFQQAPHQSIDASQGGELSFSSGARIDFPANAITAADGSPFSGMAQVSLTNIDPSFSDSQMATPGDFTALAGQGDEQRRLESYGMVYLDIIDNDGEALDIDDAMGADVWIPLAEALLGQSAPDEMPMWIFDAGEGRWIETGALSFDASSNTYMGQVDGPAFWNADLLFESACISGRIVSTSNSGAPSVEVTASGIGYIGNSTAWTDGNGNFELEVMASSAERSVGVSLMAQGGGLYLDDPVVIDETPTDLAASGCMDVGEITLTYPLARFVLTWGENPRDLDAQFTGPSADGPDRFHVYYANSRAGDQAFLDTDDTSSYGPEVISVLQAVPGTYIYSVKNFSGEGSGPILESEARIAVYTPSGMHIFEVEAATNRANGSNPVWRVFGFEIRNDGSFGPIQPIEEIVDDSQEAYHP